MPSHRVPGPLGGHSDQLDTDGLLYRVAGTLPGPLGCNAEAQQASEDVPPEFRGELLKLGSRGDEIKELQKRLKARLRGVSLDVDGVFGRPTERAVRLFQWLYGLAVAGVVDALTRKALPLPVAKRVDRGRAKPSPSPKPNPRPQPKPKPAPDVDAVPFELVELVEVVTQSAEKWVKGAAQDNTDTATIAEHVERKAKDGSNAKQFINLDQNFQGAAKRHPENGRVVKFKARVKRKSGELSGANVEFTFKRIDGPSRTAPAGVWKGADLGAAQKEGFGGSAKAAATTDAKGWTSAVSFTVSMYAGDQFEVRAKLASGTPGAPGATLKTPAKYVVWRKFWYQLTHAKGFNVPDTAKAAAAYERVGAELLKANKKEFVKADLPAGLQARTFMPEYMLTKNGGAAEVATIGAHNKDEFVKMMTKEAEYPGKAHIIVCEHQCDPAGPSKLSTYKITSRTQTLTISSGNGGSIVSKPALAGTPLVVVGEFATQKSPWTKLGDIGDADITIAPNRSGTRDVTITLPASAPTPTANAPVYVRLQVETAESFLGESFGSRQILCVYRPNAAAGAQGSEIDYNDTVAHELGHMWNQTPEPAVVPDSMNAHPLQYVGHGGQGSHCRHGATVAAGAVDWQDADEEEPSPEDGTCVMYHSYSPKCAHVFCDTCVPYLRLQDMKLQ